MSGADKPIHEGVAALRAAAHAAREMHQPPAADCAEWADWLDARADRLEADVEAYIAWSDYRKDYGVNPGDMKAAYKAFTAGWKAAREGDQSGVLR